jgi:hypothetical protein
MERNKTGGNAMIRNPMFDLFTGASLALGGPLAFMLPQRLFLEMVTGTMMPHNTPAPAERSRKTAV